MPTLTTLHQLASSLADGAIGGTHAITSWILSHPQLFTMLVLLAGIPSIFWLWLFIRKDNMDTTHRNFMALTFLLGMLSVLPVFAADDFALVLFGINLRTVFHGISWDVIGRLLYFIVCVGMLEEYAKHVVVKEVDYRRKFFTRIVDGIEFSVAAALGFAFIENILYFKMAWGLPGGTFIGVVLMRSAGSMLAHALFSGIFGYYYGRAKFLDDTPRMDRKKHLHVKMLDGMKTRWARMKHWAAGSHILVEIGHVIRRDELIAEGLFISMVLHGLYNTFLDYNKVYMVVPFLFVEFLFIWHEIEVTENRIEHLAPAKA